VPSTRFVRANGLEFEVAECGGGDRLALCLHGFPEHAVSWRRQLPMLAGLGYRAWAPNQRGYGRSSRPGRVSDYAIDRLVADVAGLIDASGAKSTVLIAHDWGGVVAWIFAARRIRPLDALIVLNMPHPLCFRRALGRWRQMRKSWYIAAFQIPWLPDLLLRLGKGWLVQSILRGSTRSAAAFSPEILSVYRDQAAIPGATTAMLNWYRAAIRGGWDRLLAGADRVIDTPTLIVWGEEDVALDPVTLDGTEELVSDLTIQRLPGVSHWVQQDVPDRVNALIADFLARTAIAP
jgi:pimeloyl-ACP methyl ester carboxylesterase